MKCSQFTALRCATLRFRQRERNRGKDIRLTKPQHPFTFKISFESPPGFDAETHDLPLDGHSVLVEVEPEGFVATPVPGDSGEAAWSIAEETARRAALETIQKDLPEGVEPVCLVVPIDRLPAEFRRRAPTLHTSGARAWLVLGRSR